MRRTYTRRPTAIIFTALLLALVPAATAQDTRDAELARLRRDNIRLRARVAELEKKETQRSSRMSTLDGDYDGSGFYSLLDKWDSLENVIVDDDPGLRSLAAVDTILVIPHDDILDKYIQLYTEQKGGNMVKILKRYDTYRPMFVKAFRRYGIPEEFAALAIVESAVNPKAVSHAGAVGMWQIMEPTARQYGLRVGDGIDERLSVEKATNAAARVLRDAYMRFGDWGQAIMSYNCGPGRMQTALAAVGDEPTYEDIWRKVPRETREYLPALVAAMYVNANRTLLLAITD